MSYQVITPLIIAKDGTGSDVYAYLGQPVPANVAEKEIERLLEGGFIEAIEETEESDLPEGDPSESWTVKQLRAYAQEFEVDLGSATTKADILSALA